MYQIYACAEIGAAKVNLELLFTGRPQLPELLAYVDEVFCFEVSVVPELQAGLAHARFRASRVCVWDKALKSWQDLISASQLYPFVQVYIFQEQGRRHIDTAHDLPVPRQLTLHRPMPQRPCRVRN